MLSTENRNRGNIIKLTVLTGLVCDFVASVIVLSTPSSNGYEVSIYSVFPSYFWFLIGIPIFLPFVILYAVHMPMSGRRFFIVWIPSLISLFLFLSLPLTRGYFFYNPGDSLTHLGYVKDLLAYGHIEHMNFYPILHIWILSLSQISGVEVLRVMLITPELFTFLYIASILALGRSLRFTARQIQLLGVLATIPIFGYEQLAVFPSSEGLLMMPIAVFLYIKSRDDRTVNRVIFSLALVPILLVYPFLNPESTLFLLLIFAVIFIVTVKASRQAVRFYEVIVSSGKGMLAPCYYLLIVFFIWFSTSVVFPGLTKAFYVSLLLNSGVSPIQSYSSILGIAQVQPVQLLKLILLLYGIALILIIGSAVELLRFLGARAHGQKQLFSSYLLVSLFSVFLVVVSIFFFKDFLIGTRPMKYLLFISTIVFGSGFLMNSLRNPSRRKIAESTISRIPRFLALVLVAVLLAIVLVSTYPSPITDLPNYQVTQAEFSGMSFYFNHRDQNLLTMEISISQHRFMDALFGVEAQLPSIRYGSSFTAPPPHFGYDTGNPLGSNYTSNQYLLLNSLAREYDQVLPEYKSLLRYSNSDFQLLESDWTVNLICDNGGFEAFYVLGVGP